MLDARCKAFEHDWKSFQSLIVDDDREQQQEVHKVKQEFAELLSLVLSRTTSLGPEWGNQRGVYHLCQHLSKMEVICVLLI